MHKKCKGRNRHSAQCHIRLKKNNWYWEDSGDHAADNRDEVEEKRKQAEQWGQVYPTRRQKYTGKEPRQSR